MEVRGHLYANSFINDKSIPHGSELLMYGAAAGDVPILALQVARYADKQFGYGYTSLHESNFVPFRCQLASGALHAMVSVSGRSLSAKCFEATAYCKLKFCLIV